MPFTSNEIATYLFCAQLSHTKTTPLTILEWNAVVKSLGESRLQPEALLTMSSSELFNNLTQATESQKSKILAKFEARQKLGVTMLELEELAHHGFGIMFRSHMPKRLKKLTTKYTPAFFYYAGDPSILEHRTLGIVGARDAKNEELSETASISNEAVSHGVVIISGGAKGVDTIAVDAALQSGGKAVVFPSEGITKWVKKSEIRQYIINGQLLLISSQRLDAGFTPAYAMQRNKYIHAPSDAVLVSSSKVSGTKSSGTWEGVMENLKNKWSPIYVIGNSEGVKRLLADGVAKSFTSFADIFKISIQNDKTDKSNFNKMVTDLVQFALREGMDRKMIEDSFNKALSQHYMTGESRSLVEMVQESKGEEMVEQLSLEDLI
jgi:DNA processing protein